MLRDWRVRESDSWVSAVFSFWCPADRWIPIFNSAFLPPSSPPLRHHPPLPPRRHPFGPWHPGRLRPPPARVTITISFEGLIKVLTFDPSLRSYRFSQIFEPLFQAKDLLVLVGQQYQQVVLLLLGLLHRRLQLRLLRLQDGDRAGGRGQLLLQLRPALRRALGFSLSPQNTESSETMATEPDRHQI